MHNCFGFRIFDTQFRRVLGLSQYEVASGARSMSFIIPIKHPKDTEYMSTWQNDNMHGIDKFFACDFTLGFIVETLFVTEIWSQIIKSSAVKREGEMRIRMYLGFTPCLTIKKQFWVAHFECLGINFCWSLEN
jgi:hypothetical protein